MVVDVQQLAEYRYRTVREVLGGSPIGEVAARYGTSRQTLHTWRRRFVLEGMPGLLDRSRRPRNSPARLSAEVEAEICELRRRHPMHLWQVDLVGGVPLADGRECKMVTGVDDHSRFVVIASVVAVPSARAVCSAFTAAMRRYGVPFEGLTDNGKQFTGRRQRPQPVEVLFERICRENGITQRLTKPRSPTTTGKIERSHRTLREEFLDHVVPFESLAAAQEAIDG